MLVGWADNRGFSGRSTRGGAFTIINDIGRIATVRSAVGRAAAVVLGRHAVSGGSVSSRGSASLGVILLDELG